MEELDEEMELLRAISLSKMGVGEGTRRRRSGSRSDVFGVFGVLRELGVTTTSRFDCVGEGGIDSESFPASPFFDLVHAFLARLDSVRFDPVSSMYSASKSTSYPIATMLLRNSARPLREEGSSAALKLLTLTIVVVDRLLVAMDDEEDEAIVELVKEAKDSLQSATRGKAEFVVDLERLTLSTGEFAAEGVCVASTPSATRFSPARAQPTRSRASTFSRFFISRRRMRGYWQMR